MKMIEINEKNNLKSFKDLINDYLVKGLDQKYVLLYMTKII